MALARVVTFDGVSQERMDELNSRMESGQPPEGMPDAELLALHDPAAREVDRHRHLRERGRLQEGRRDPRQHAVGRHARDAHVRDEVQRRDTHEVVGPLAPRERCDQTESGAV